MLGYGNSSSPSSTYHLKRVIKADRMVKELYFEMKDEVRLTVEGSWE